MTYRVIYQRDAAKAVERLPARDRQAIFAKMTQLAAAPYQMPGVKRLQGSPAFRFRVGDYRIVYVLEDNQLLVTVVRIAHRREVYR
jgi:mRNA interferase RelE/StbE